MALYLTGGGDQEEFSGLDRLFIEGLHKGAKVGILAQAADDEQDALERLEDCFSHNKISTFQLIQNDKEDLSQFDALMIEGGNTFNLIRSIRDSHFYNSIKSFYQSGKSIYADSAGAIILGSDVHTAFLGDDGDEDELSLQDYRGLDIFSPWCIHAHATGDDFDQLNDLLYQTGSPILALAEETGILVQDQSIKVFGSHELWVIDFEGRKSIQVGDSFSY